MSDLSKPNHFYHDSLGDPATCTGDHNHPAPEGCQPSDCCGDPSAHALPQEVIDKAREAICVRCQAVVVDEPSRAGTVMINYYVPALGVRERVVLCGACGLGFGEYLNDPTYLAAKAQLQAMWS